MLQAVAVAPSAGLLHQGLLGLGVHVVRERLVLLVAHFPVETLLKVAAKVFRHGFLRILLHLVIDGGVYAQAVPVEVVLRAVGLLVLVEPSVNRVIAPAQGIRAVVLVVLVIGPLRL